jgi:hypothetical protein
MSEVFEAEVSVAPGAVSIGGNGVGTARTATAVTATATAITSNASSDSDTDVDAKIMADLDMLMEKMDLAESMLRPGADGSPAPSVVQDDACKKVIGFLEACAPRMVELVEAAAQGAVKDAVLMKALDVNDRLTKQLADIDTIALTETPASTTAAAAPAGSSTDAEAAADHLDDLLLSDDTDGDLFGDDDSKLPAATKSTGEEDDNDNLPIGTAVVQPSAKSEDEFDSFFNERTTS